eukprot:763217-Hanusia_phi.AAC.1
MYVFVEEPLRISSFSPSRVPLLGGVPLRIILTSELGYSEVRCNIGNSSLPPIFARGNLVLCRVPQREPGRCQVAISTPNSLLVSEMELDYPHVYFEILSHFPTMCSPGGGTTISVRLSLLAEEKVSCKFGSISVPGIVRPYTSLVVCQCPKHETGAVNFQLVGNHEKKSASFSFEFVEPPLILEIKPATFSMNEAVQLTLYGRGFGTEMLHCKLGRMMQILCFPRDTLSATCDWTPILYPGLHAISCSLNKMDYRTSRQMLEVLSRCMISSVRPSSVPFSSKGRLTITGSGFSPGISCRFGTGDLVFAVYITSSLLQCEYPRQDQLSRVPVSLYGIQSRQKMCMTMLEYFARPDIQHSSILPNDPTGTSVLVSVVGSNFQSTATCRASYDGKHQTVRVIFTTSTLVRCVLNEQYLRSGSELFLSNDGTDYMPVSRDQAACIPEPLSFHLQPSLGQTFGGTRVIFSSKGIPQCLMHLRCRFGNKYSTESKILSSTRIVCFSPPHFQGNVSIRLMIQGMQFNKNTLLFQYQRTFNLNNFTPQSFLVGQGVNVTVIGSGFTKHAGYQCVFGNDEVLAEWLSSSSLVCHSVVYQRPSLIAVSVCTDHVSRTCVVMKEKALVFLRPHVLSIRPSMGPAHGGAKLTIFGLNLEMLDPMCIFGDGFATPARMETSSTATCFTPSRSPGSVNFRYGLESWEKAAPMTYTFTNNPIIVSAMPDHAKLCKTKGITVHGYNLHSESSACHMNDIRTRLQLVDEYTAICVLPCLQEFLGELILRVCSRGQHCSNSLDLHTTISNRPLSIWPTRSPLRGGIRIRLIGDFNTGGYTLNVTLGQFSTLAITNGSRSQEYEFFAPPQDNLGVFIFSVRKSGSAFDIGSFALEYYACAEITSLIPSWTWIRGSFQVTLAGSNFMNQTQCKVGDLTMSDTSFVSSSRIVCRVATLHSFKPFGEVQVTLMQDGISSTSCNNRAVFFYTQQPSIQRAYPTFGGLVGGQSVQLTLTELQAEGSITCHFGKNKAPGSIVSSTIVLCMSPPSEIAANVSLGVSVDGFAIARSSEEYMYVDLGIIVSARVSCCMSKAGRCVLFQSADLTNLKDVRCLMGHDQAIPLSVSSTSVSCEVPSALLKGTRLGIAEGPMILSGGGLEYSGSLIAEVHQIQPSSGFLSGGTEISVFGFGFCSNDKWLCRFGVNLVRAKYATSSLLHCKSPPATRVGKRSSGKSISLVVKGENINVQVDEGRFTFLYLPEVRSLSLSPSRITSGVASSISIMGADFTTIPRIQALLNGAFVSRANFVSSTLLTLALPSLKFGSYLLEMQFVNTDSFLLSTVLHADNSSTVKHVIPSHSRLEGGQVVNISGIALTGLSDTCKFGSIPVKCTHLNSMVIQCLSPSAQSSGRTNLDLYLGERLYASLPFLYSQDLIDDADSIRPSVGMHGQQVRITFSGRFFTLLDEGRCRVRNTRIVMSSTPLSSTAIGCIMPPLSPGSYAVYLEQDATRTSDFQYISLESWYVKSVVPRKGVCGQLKSIRVVGGRFPLDEEMSCLLGDFLSRAEVLSSSEILCQVASLPCGNYTMALKAGTAMLHTQHLLELMSPIRVSRIWPTATPKVSCVIQDQYLNSSFDINGDGFAPLIQESRSNFSCKADWISDWNQ